ncbi:MAG TPA: TIGR03087 family PEP-CTERM/XrtA system glycosyltransferase [Aliidongia sp.]|uniref:TIGR03087 family PEP-CTERM/XrtA system glycosyltransferase n=1 Tax=Aliidongia sp. TaxID=1914230 RepID=UPI002DDCC390|nr:TIGR03087 family PEP-CTERM/XrtA system glycosyltransferase [Aliidongia sp.]HEV2673683.1 TIGR03087 family PEP-CTERM/XrtA system glycosyltransferase [Aliidongia sp.]
MANLLFLTQRIPYPPIKGEKIRPLQILKHLRETHDVHLGCLVDDPRDLEHVPTVRALCKDSYFATLDRRRAKINALTGLLTGQPLSVVFYRDRGLARWVRQVMRDVKPEVIFICSSNMAPYVIDLREPRGVCLVDLADVDSEKWRAYSEKESFPMGWVYAREWRRTAALEARILKECDWSTFVSAEEAALFARLQLGNPDKIRAISSGVDHVYFDPTHRFDAPYATDRLNFVFTGTMDYPPNVDAVVWYAREILPIIRSRSPGAQFHVVGSSPSPEVQALATLDGVFVTGRVPDVRPYVAHANAGVAPMRIARGIQNKVLEAMAMGRPVVVTKDALEGIDAKPGTEVFLAESAEDFASACLRAATAEGEPVGQAARRRILSDYIWAERLRGFDPLLGIPAPAVAQKVALS